MQCCLLGKSVDRQEKCDEVGDRSHQFQQPRSGPDTGDFPCPAVYVRNTDDSLRREQAATAGEAQLNVTLRTIWVRPE